MKKLYFLVIAALLGAGLATAQPARPKLVVGIVVDQMRWDYLYTYYNNWGEGGFKRLLDEGFSCQNTIIDYIPTVTAIGHASVYTGSVPALHGIAGNDFIIDGRHVGSVTDTTVVGVGTTGKAGKHSPRNLWALTIGDQLKLATNMQGRVVSVAIKDRASILPGGHSADAAYWYDGDTHSFITSTYYMNELPKWVKSFNSNHSDDLRHNVKDEPQGVMVTLGMAREALINEQLGQDDVTDLLAISVSTTDAAAHHFGTHSAQVDAAYRQLDTELASLFSLLDKRVGKGNYLVWLTADHGGTNDRIYMDERRMPSAGWLSGKALEAVNEELKARFGIDNLIKAQKQFTFYLDNELIEQWHLNRDAVKRVACETLAMPHEVMWAIDMENVGTAPVPQVIKERLIKGYVKGRSGEIAILPRVYVYAGNDKQHGSQHGTLTQSDSHIPLVFMGWGVGHGETFARTGIVDIAPTICALLHIQAPNAAIGNPILQVIESK